MITRGGRGHGVCGRSNARRRGHNYTVAISTSTSNKGLCNDLTKNVFNFGHKAAAYQMCTSMGKIVQYVGTKYGKDISNELQNRDTVNITEPVHTHDIIRSHVLREAMARTGQANIQVAQESK